MSKDWTPDELAAASEAMKEAGHMSYEEFCAELKEQEAKAAIERFGTVQRKSHFACPRCGKNSMDEDPIRNALSRHAKCYVCDACGTDEAMRDFAGIPLPFSEWSLIVDVYNPLNGGDNE